MLDALCDAGLCVDYVWSCFMKTTVLDGRFATPGRGLMLAGEASGPGEDVTASAPSVTNRTGVVVVTLALRSSTSSKSELMLSTDSTSVGSIENDPPSC
jgi:hypothetical protein